jgi:hypothetical protein
LFSSHSQKQPIYSGVNSIILVLYVTVFDLIVSPFFVPLTVRLPLIAVPASESSEPTVEDC